MTSQVISFLGVEDVFLEVGADIDNLRRCLQTLSLTDALIWCARLNLLVSNPELDPENHGRETQKLILQWFFTKEQCELVWKKSEGFNKSVICMRAGLLELMRWVLLWCKNSEGDGETFRKQDVRQTFAKAMLIANKIWLDTTDFAQITTRPVDDEGRELLMLALRRNHEGSYIGHINPMMWVGFGHSIFCRKKYLEKHYTTLREDFRKATGIEIDDYYICKSFLVSHFYLKTLSEIAAKPENSNGIFDINSAGNEVLDSMKPAVRTYLEFESQTIEELRKGFWGERLDVATLSEAGSFDARVMLDRPILRIRDGRGIILDSLFFAERAAAGPIFIIRKKLKKPAQELIGYYGAAFEDYTHFFFKKIYCARVNKLGVEMSRPQQSGDVDIGLKLDRQLAILEIKASFLNLNVIYGTDNAAYLEELRKKYVNTWGAEQLATAIKNLSTDVSVNGIAPRDLDRIFPILFVRDPHLDSALHPWFLAREFKTKLQPDQDTGRGDMAKGRLSIPNLITMTMDELLALEDSIHRGIPFHKLLSDYTLEHRDRLISLNDFLALDPRYKKRIYKYKIVGRHMHKLIVKARKKLFKNGMNNDHK
ncbi:MAG: hypothetical protein PHZ00_00455 [Candidatus Peribacteraceae bacterium]|nr:hypothetical protein [Candidatus Peribacteraceae bacterium]